jgi:hypothetical protein
MSGSSPRTLVAGTPLAYVDFPPTFKSVTVTFCKISTEAEDRKRVEPLAKMPNLPHRKRAFAHPVAARDLTQSHACLPCFYYCIL